MELLDLPPELLERVLRYYVNTVGVVKSWTARSACRTFRHYLDHEIFACQPTRAFIRKGSCGRKLLKSILGQFLARRVEKVPSDMHTAFPNFINHIVDDLVSPDEVSTVRAKYIDVLCKVGAHRSPLVYHLAIVEAKKRIFRPKVVLLAEDVIVNKVAAAAAVGDLTSLQRYLVGSRKEIWTKSAIFGYPLEAASSAGELQIVKVICKHNLKDWWAVSGSKARLEVFYCAVDAAIQSDQRLVMTFLLRHCVDYRIGCFNRAMSIWLPTAICKRDIGFVTTLLYCGMLPTRDTLAEAFELAVQLNEVEIALLFCRGSFLPVDQTYDGLHYPLGVAAHKGRLEIVNGLLAIGADPNGPVNPRPPCSNFSRPLFHAVQEGHFSIVRVLLDHGANPHLIKLRGTSQIAGLRSADVHIKSAVLDALKKTKDIARTARYVKDSLERVPELIP